MRICSELFGFFRQICRGDAESICFSCSKDIGKYEVVCMRERLCEFMEEHRVQKHKDNTVVNKVNRLKDAIEELSDGDDMDFSVAELSAYLDMSVEEIEDILRIAGEEP